MVDLVAPPDVNLAALPCGADFSESGLLEKATAFTINSIPDLKAQGVAATDILNIIDNPVCTDGTENLDGVAGWATVGSSTKYSAVVKGESIALLSVQNVFENMAHEYGHTLGLQHAGTAECENDHTCLSATSGISEYGDPYNLMNGSTADGTNQGWNNRDSKSVNIFQKYKLGWVNKNDVKCIGRDVLGDNPMDTPRTYTVHLNALWQNNGIRGIGIGGKSSDTVGYDTEEDYNAMCSINAFQGQSDDQDVVIEYRPKTSQGTDNFIQGVLSPGILVYRTDPEKDDDLKLLNGRDLEAGGTHVDNITHSYTQAAVSGPFKTVDKLGSNYICVVPSNATEEGVDLQITVGDNLDSGCNNVKAGDYSLVDKWGSAGTGDGQFGDFPEDVATDSSGNIYAIDANVSNGNNLRRVEVFDRNGKFVKKWGSYGTGDGQFQGGMALTVDSSSNVYISEGYSGIIRKFDNNGKTLKVWGGRGGQDGKFNYAMGLATDSSNNLYVADNNNRIQKFDSNGNFITKWGSSGTGNGQFNEIWDVAVDSENNVYATDLYNNRIQKFDSNGNFITKWGSSGTGNGQFKFPQEITVDSAGNVYTYEDGVDRIQKFDSDGTYITSWIGYQEASNGSGTAGIAADNSGNIFTVSYYPFIQKFSQKAIDANSFKVLNN